MREYCATHSHHTSNSHPCQFQVLHSPDLLCFFLGKFCAFCTNWTPMLSQYILSCSCADLPSQIVIIPVCTYECNHLLTQWQMWHHRKVPLPPLLCSMNPLHLPIVIMLIEHLCTCISNLNHLLTPLMLSLSYVFSFFQLTSSAHLLWPMHHPCMPGQAP